GDPEQTPAKRKELAQTIFQEAERLNRLVRNLLDMSRLESEAVNLNLEWESVEELIGTAASRVEGLLGGRKLTTSIAKDLPLVKVDSMLMGQVLVNLLENACRHTPEGSDIRIRASRADGKIEISVSDSGPGIEVGDETKIFEKFYRNSKLSEGSGLGLAIAKA